MRLGLGLSITGRLRSSGASFILNRFSGAAAAYSLRKLSASATSVVRVRRSSDNAELDFTPSEINDGSLLTWVGAGDGLVTTWYDQSGNANDATQATAASQPKIVDAGVLVSEGGKAALDFDGVDDFMQSPNGAIGEVDAVTAFAVGSITNGNNRTIITASSGDYGGNTDNWFALRRVTGNFNAVRNFGVAGEAIITTVAPSDSDFHLFQMINTRTFVTLFVDGSSETTSSTDTGALNISAEIDIRAVDSGGDVILHSPGRSSEIILYPSDQSANRTDIEADIADYYGITLT